MKKKILVCDDDDSQYETLKETLELNYDVARSHHYLHLLADIERESPIQLVILDLGFPKGNYTGHSIIPEVVKQYPKLKIIIYSDLAHIEDLSEANREVLRELVSFSPNVAGFLSPHDAKAQKIFTIDSTLGTSKWLRNEELFILHLSDLQLGGSGLNISGKELIRTIFSGLDGLFSASDDDLNGLKFPDIATLTGDLTECASPKQFNEIQECIDELADKIKTYRSEMFGVLKNNVIVIPGNHDQNWTLSYAQHLSKENNEIVYKEEPQKNLEFILRYRWLPFCELLQNRSLNNPEWAYKPGYDIINLKEELHLIFVRINSSLWGVDHTDQNAIIPLEVVRLIEEKLKEIDPDKVTTRILLSHHTLDKAAEKKDKLKLQEHPENDQMFYSILSKDCGFSLVLSGHVHKFVVEELGTGNRSRTLHNIGAGTARSDDMLTNYNQQFNIIRLFNLNENNRFGEFTVYPFRYNDNAFAPENCFKDKRKSSETFNILYT